MKKGAGRQRKDCGMELDFIAIGLFLVVFTRKL